MDIESLYPLVTEAIRRAEVFDEIQAPGARDAHRDVSLLEERIASLLAASTSEGAIARRGAVRAAIAAGDVHRAHDLATRFSAEGGTTDALRHELDEIVEEARNSSADVGELDANRWPRASARYGLSDIQRFVREFRNQGAPLPIW
jgi:hypothetical protein